MSRSLDRSEGGWVVYLKFAHSWCKSMLSLCSIDVDLVSEVYPHAFLLYDRPVEYLNLIFCYQFRLYLGTTIVCKESYKALIYSEGISFYKLGLLPNENFLFSKNPFCDFFLKNERNLLLIFNWIAWIVLPATSWLAFFFVFFFFIVRKYHSIELNQHSAELCCRDRHLDGATQWARMLFEGKHCCLKIWANTDLFLFYFQPFLIPASITVSIWILKAETVLMVCLGFERAFRMVGAVETTELLRPPKGPLLSHELLKPSTELLVVSCCVYEMPKEV